MRQLLESWLMIGNSEKKVSRWSPIKACFRRAKTSWASKEVAKARSRRCGAIQVTEANFDHKLYNQYKTCSSFLSALAGFQQLPMCLYWQPQYGIMKKAWNCCYFCEFKFDWITAGVPDFCAWPARLQQLKGHLYGVRKWKLAGGERQKAPPNFGRGPGGGQLSLDTCRNFIHTGKISVFALKCIKNESMSWIQLLFRALCILRGKLPHWTQLTFK